MNNQRRPLKDSFIQRLKDSTDIISIIGNRVQLKQSGAGKYMGLCPFHDEKTASFSVSSEGFFHCFGCGAKGDTLGFIMQSESVDFYDAIHRLAETQNIPVEYATSSYDISKPQYEFAADDYEVNQIATDFYVRQLKLPQNIKAMNYFTQRKCSPEILAEYKLGYAPLDNDALWRHITNDRLKQAALRVSLVKQNEKGDYYDVFRNRVMFPIIDSRQRVLGFGGRVINGINKAKYINSSDSHIFHKEQTLFGLPQALKSKLNKNRVLVVEGYTDVLAMFGLERSVACLGTAFSRFHARQLLQKFGTLVLAFDGDEAGNKAAMRAMRQSAPFLTDDKELLVQFMPQGKDPYDLVSEAIDKQQAWDELNPITIEEFLLKPFYESQGMDLQRSRFAINQLTDFLANFPSGGVRAGLICKKAGDLLGGVRINLPQKNKPADSKKFRNSHFQKHAATNVSPVAEKIRMDLLQKLIVQLILQPKKANGLLKKCYNILDEAAKMKNGSEAQEALNIIDAAHKSSAYLYGYIMALNINFTADIEKYTTAFLSAGECVVRILDNVYNRELKDFINDGDRIGIENIKNKKQILKDILK